jgi:hypothetical protein
MAAIRDQFMQCEELGSKEMRYAAYRIVISDFSLFLGKEAQRKMVADLSHFSASENYRKEVAEMLSIWEPKEKKLQAILQLTQSIRREDIPGKNSLRYFYEQNALAKGSPPFDTLIPATASLAEAYQTYFLYRRQQQIFLLKELRHLKADIVRAPFEEQFPIDALYCLKYARTEEEREEIKQTILEELQDGMEPARREKILEMNNLLKMSDLREIDREHAERIISEEREAQTEDNKKVTETLRTLLVEHGLPDFLPD